MTNLLVHIIISDTFELKMWQCFAFYKLSLLLIVLRFLNTLLSLRHFKMCIYMYTCIAKSFISYKALSKFPKYLSFHRERNKPTKHTQTKKYKKIKKHSYCSFYPTHANIQPIMMGHVQPTIIMHYVITANHVLRHHQGHSPENVWNPVCVPATPSNDKVYFLQ